MYLKTEKEKKKRKRKDKEKKRKPRRNGLHKLIAEMRLLKEINQKMPKMI